MQAKPIAVSELVHNIKKVLEGTFRFVYLEGEVSNLSSSYSGHWYFTLSDQDSSVSIALFKGDALRNPLIKKLKEGEKVILQGAISVYPRRGTFQVVAKTLKLAGEGDLKLKFEMLKKKLSTEGLFNIESKKPIPQFPRKVAVITSEDGAALQDFLSVYKRRSFWYEILLVPSLVQGAKSPLSLRKALDKIVNTPESTWPDVVVLTRGGGSLEDLMGFNDEGLARDIFDFPIPVISAVGHEPDYSICDYVADKRCETPTAAAEFLTQEQTQLIKRFSHIQKSLNYIFSQKVSKMREKLQNLYPIKVLEKLQRKREIQKQRLLALSLPQRANELVPIDSVRNNLEQVIYDLEQGVTEKTKNLQRKLDILESKLQALGPMSVLKRGFCFATSNKKLLRSAKEFNKLAPTEKVDLVFHDDRVEVQRAEK